MAEGQAKSGHDIMGLLTFWYVSAQVDRFVPVDDIVEPLITKYGTIATSAEYCGGKIDGRRMAVPTCYGSASFAAVRPHRHVQRLPGSLSRRCTRTRHHARYKALVDNWTWDTICESPRNARRPGIRSASGSAPAFFDQRGEFNRRLWRRSVIDAKDSIVISYFMKQALEWYKRIAKSTPHSLRL